MPYLMTRDGYLHDLDDSFEMIMKYDIVFVGEDHGSRVAHEAEFTLLTGLVERDPALVLALEMFERDVQHTLDDYLRGRISEEIFLEAARPWPNYQEDYRPLIQLAKIRGIPVIAANVPRRAAAAVAVANKLSPEVVGEDKIYLPTSLHPRSKDTTGASSTRSKECLTGLP